MSVQTLSVDPLTSKGKGQILDLGDEKIIQHGFIYDSDYLALILFSR
jgi:hypothetical protein